MKAVRARGRGGPEQLAFEDIQQPLVGKQQILVRVHATAVMPTELGWSTTWETEAGAPREAPVPGHDLSGVVASVGPGVTGWAPGDPVYGLIDFYRDGAEAEYAIALPGELAPKPQSLDFVQAAAVPIAALTAWQALFDHGQLAAGQHALIHGGSGGVGTFAVQLAHMAGARVTATASGHNRDLVRDLGADDFIDYQTTRFEDAVRDMDFILDTVGGSTLVRSWAVLKRGGTLVSIVDEPPRETAASHGVRAMTFIVEPNPGQLGRIGELIDAERLHHPVVQAVLPLSRAREAYERARTEHGSGKLVLEVAA